MRKNGEGDRSVEKVWSVGGEAAGWVSGCHRVNCLEDLVDPSGICILWGIQWNYTRASLDWHAHRPVIGTHLHLFFTGISRNNRIPSKEPLNSPESYFFRYIFDPSIPRLWQSLPIFSSHDLQPFSSLKSCAITPQKVIYIYMVYISGFILPIGVIRS